VAPDLYSNLDLVYQGDGKNLRFDLVARPEGSLPSRAPILSPDRLDHSLKNAPAATSVGIPLPARA
jgi:hypothetical protein